MRRKIIVRATSVLIVALCLVAPRVDAEAIANQFTIHADLSEASRGLIRGKLSIPITEGPLTLVYPQWIPGDHGPTGPITDLSGLKFTAGGKPVEWRRDLTDLYAFHLNVPSGEKTLAVELEYLAPTSGEVEEPSTSSQLAVLNWNLITLLPQGSDAAKITVTPSASLPKDWKFGCAMETEASATADETVRFKPTTLDMLIDHPLIAAQHFKQLDLTPGAVPQHVIDVGADSDAALAITADRLKAYRQLPVEYAAVFGARHYERYHFLLALSDRLGETGLEHHECSDNRAAERALVDDDVFANFASLLTHEYFHSWNGKFRRPKGLLSPDYQRPMQDDLLWIYEGLTEYYGDVMAARAGLWKPEEYREHIAAVATGLSQRKGRTWRPLQDTADMASKLYRSSRQWSMRRRGVDYYDEGDLIWLEVDTLIRQKTGNAKSLDDFCRAFYGDVAGGASPQGSKPSVVLYEAADVFATLNQILPYDWKAFFTQRLTSLDPEPPLGGIAQAGYKLSYSNKSNKMLDAGSKANKRIDLRASLGLILSNEEGEHTVIDVVPASPADKAGVGPGMKLLAVNSRKFDDDVLKDALAATPTSKSVELLFENATYYWTAKLAYDGGPRSPHLERASEVPDLIEKIIAPRAK
jgi:predicted metalloprotease with PDZ domain